MRYLQPIAFIFGSIILIIFVGTLLALLFTGWGSEYVRSFVMEHFRTVVCLPAAGLFAFLIVAFFQLQAGGQVEYKVLGLEFKGPGGPITMWVLSFLAIAVAISLNWP